MLPLLRLKIQVVYVTDAASSVSQTCGEDYAKAFLENLLLTEQSFQTRQVAKKNVGEDVSCVLPDEVAIDD